MECYARCNGHVCVGVLRNLVEEKQSYGVFSDASRYYVDGRLDLLPGYIMLCDHFDSEKRDWVTGRIKEILDCVGLFLDTDNQSPGFYEKLTKK